MKRRDFFKSAGIGSAAVFSTSALPQQGRPEASDGHGHTPLEGSLTNAVVSFGQWRTDFQPPLDRFSNAPPPPPTNHHQLFPFEALIRAGGSVMFVIAGLHNIQVYESGTKPSDIVTTMTIPTAGVPAGVPIIDFPNGRLYRGPDPSVLPNPFDRTEAVQFPRRGRYLVICGVMPHFVNDDMFGYVRVV